METKQLLTPGEVARILNCNPSSVYAWAKTGRIPAHKINGLVRFDPVEIEAWIKGSKIKPEPPGRPVRRKPVVRPVRDVDGIIKSAIASFKRT